MSRYIDVDKLIGLADDTKPVDKIIVKILQNTPIADVVEVVRCKDCKHYSKDGNWCDIISHFIKDDKPCMPYESREWIMVCDDDYCFFGEREE